MIKIRLYQLEILSIVYNSHLLFECLYKSKSECMSQRKRLPHVKWPISVLQCCILMNVAFFVGDGRNYNFFLCSRVRTTRTREISTLSFLPLTREPAIFIFITWFYYFHNFMIISLMNTWDMLIVFLKIVKILRFLIHSASKIIIHFAHSFSFYSAKFLFGISPL